MSEDQQAKLKRIAHDIVDEKIADVNRKKMDLQHSKSKQEKFKNQQRSP